MAVLTVGSGQQYSTLTAAVAASHDGDTIQVQAGVYTNDFPAAITTKISIVGVGGMAHFVAAEAPPNGKAILVTTTDVTIDHLEFSGAQVPDDNGAGIRFEGGNLTITNSYFHDNEDGILSGEVIGTVTIDHSEFAHNGAGDGFSHNLYLGHISNVTVTNSYFHDTPAGHEFKSRADTTVLLNNRFVDGNATASYEIDLPNGGNATIKNNVIEQGPNSENHTIIAYAEETGSPWAGSQLIIDGNTILNDQPGNPLAVWNTAGGITAQITGNHFYGLSASQIAAGPNSQFGNDFLPTEPIIDTSHPWTDSSPPLFTSIESNGVTTLAQSANHVYLLDGSGSGPTVKYAGADITLGQFGGWTPLGAEKVASGGYEVAWKMMGADQFSFWNTDSNGNYITNLGGVVSGADPTLQSAETLFQQDLNGDGHIGVGVATTPIESNGATILAQAANHFYLLDSSGSGPTVKYAGADITLGQFGGWTPLGAEKVASGGYEIAWKMMGADQFSFWNTDSNGNYIANLGGVVSGADPTLQSAETLFQQDLNGDGHIGVGVATTPIESNGATTLAQAANHFYLLDSSGSGPTVKYAGDDVTAGQFGGWTPLGAEKVASGGYEIAWKMMGADQFSFWTTDSNGNYIANLGGVVSGSDPTLQSAETLFQQDLNGDGHIGLSGAQMAVAQSLDAASAINLQNDVHHDWML